MSSKVAALWMRSRSNAELWRRLGGLIQVTGIWQQSMTATWRRCYLPSPEHISHRNPAFHL